MPRPELPLALLPNQSIIRHHILYEARLGTPVFKAFNNFCDAFGDDQIEYVKYEFWYYRFYQGNFDMEYDRSADPKPKQLTDMPQEVFTEIIAFLDVKDRIHVAKTSPILREVTEIDKGQFDEIKFFIDKLTALLNLVKNRDKNGAEWYKQWNYKDEKDPIEEILENVAIALKNPNIEMERILVFGYDEPHNGLRRFVNSLQSISTHSNSQFHVKTAKLQIDNLDQTLSLLSLLKPGILKKIAMYRSKEKVVCDERILQMDQFKQAKIVDINGICFNATHLKHFYHFNSFVITLDQIGVDELDLLLINLSKSTNFKKCILYSHTGFFDCEKIGDYFGIVHSYAGYFECRYRASESSTPLFFVFNLDRIDIYCSQPTRSDSEDSEESEDSESEDSESDDDDF